MLAALALASAGFLLWRSRYRYPGLVLASAWWSICLAPTVIVPLNVLVNDHRPYLAMAGIALAAACLYPRVRGHRWLLEAAVPIVLLVLCWQRASVWRTEISLWEDAIRQGSEIAASHHNLAFAYHQKNRLEPATRHYEKAISLEPEYTRPLTNLGILYRQAGKLERAEEVLLRAVRSAPGLVEPLNNLGLVYTAQRRPEQAVSVYRTALQVDPDVGEVWFNLGLAQRDAGRREEAFNSLQRALQLDPGIRQRLEITAP